MPEEKKKSMRPGPVPKPETDIAPEVGAAEPRGSGSGLRIAALGFLLLVVLIAANMKC